MSWQEGSRIGIQIWVLLIPKLQLFVQGWIINSWLILYVKDFFSDTRFVKDGNVFPPD
jgi:hypothetical protein